ncbi:MAG: hypothetical protein GWO86_03215 [Planctomycetes bacterium]|nr:hypothetical protein [Planctomycetota bacterium]
MGSFLNVVIYRLPRDKSIISPPSACPVCNKPIAFYDNIPLFSWLFLRAKCRNCKSPISVRYFFIELITGLLFAALYFLYFMADVRSGIGTFTSGGWFIYLVHVILLTSLLAASAIDLELWVIPLSICWFAAAVGIIASALAGLIIAPAEIIAYDLFPAASARTAIIAAGAAIGLIISILLLLLGWIKRSYDTQNSSEDTDEPEIFNHRIEMLKEVVFLAPVIICSYLAFYIYKSCPPFTEWWIDFSQVPAVSGILGSVFGYFIGCAIVWLTRILGTLAFGKEAMGLGDVHLMGAAGAVIGPVFVVVAFFLAPFSGLIWACFQMFFKKTRQIPYGPFLSLGLFAVMILYDEIRNYLGFILFH